LVIAAFDEQYSRAAAADNTSTQSDTLLATGSGARCAGCSGSDTCRKNVRKHVYWETVMILSVFGWFYSDSEAQNNWKTTKNQ
jgi:hypothetical protein